MKYPQKATIYVYASANGKVTYAAGDSFPCQAEQSPSKLKSATGAITTADCMVFCDLKNGKKTKKQDRLYIDKGFGFSDIVDIVKPEPAGNRRCEIYAKLNSTAKIVNGVMQ